MRIGRNYERAFLEKAKKIAIYQILNKEEEVCKSIHGMHLAKVISDNLKLNLFNKLSCVMFRDKTEIMMFQLMLVHLLMEYYLVIIQI